VIVGTLAAAIWQNRMLAGAVLGLLSVIAVWTDGYSRGTEAERAGWEARTLTIRLQRAGAQALAAAQSEALTAAAIERAALLSELEAAANADPDADRPALGPDAVRRLQGFR
jgi:hypothetical protein